MGEDGRFERNERRTALLGGGDFLRIDDRRRGEMGRVIFICSSS